MSTDRPRRRLSLAVLLAALAAGPARGSEGPPPTLNPTSYASPSGEYSLLVDPGDMYGRGGGSYRLTKRGREVWSGKRPFTLWEATVSDEGEVAGYAYSHGWRGFAEAGIDAGMGEFRVVILDARGKARLEQVAKREKSRYLHTPPNPLAGGMLLDAANDRMVVRVRDPDVNRQSEAWWTYQLSTGKRLAEFRPKELMPAPDPARFVIDARPVAGTTLTLLHWWRYDLGGNGTVGARFTLIDGEGKPVWSRDLPDDYMIPADEAAGDRLRESIRRTGAILRTDQAGRFELRFVKDARRVTFAVARAPDGSWSVSEVERQPYAEPVAPVARPDEIPVRPLCLAGRIDLKTPAAGPVSSIRDVSQFVFDDRGRIAFLREIGGNRRALVLTDQQGDVLQTVRLDTVRPENVWGWADLAWVGGDRFLLIRDDPKNDNRMDAWWVYSTRAKVVRVPEFSLAAPSNIAGFADGGFAVREGSCDLNGRDSRGRRLWSRSQGDPDDLAAPYSVAGIAATTDGKIAVLDHYRGLVQYFDRGGGKHLRTIELKASWGRDPSYPTAISADRDGGVVVHDFQGKPPIIRMNAEGTVRAQVQPRFADGRTFRIHDMGVAPDGRLWVSDRHAIFRLAESGVVDRVLGEGPDPARLDRADAMTVDAKGRLYAVVGRTGAVHVFDPDGRWIRTCAPDPGDVAEELILPQVTASDAGDVYLGLLGLGDVLGNRYLHFSPEGKRVGIERPKLDEIMEDWYQQPGTGRRWVLGYEKAFLVDAAGAVVRTIDRRADGHWLERPQSASVAPDGSIAIVSNGESLSDDGPTAVSLYSALGDPIRTFMLPPSLASSYPHLAYDGKLVAVMGDKDVILLDTSGKALGRFNPPQDDDPSWTPLLTPASHELLLFNGRLTLYRFALP